MALTVLTARDQALDSRLRPPMPYFGGKQRIASKIVALFPEHVHYVEPFCGSLAVLAAKSPSRMETVNDLDGHLMTFWRVLRDRPDDLARACAMTPHSRAEYLEVRERGGLSEHDELEIARRVWTVLTQGRNAQSTKTGWRTYIGGRPSFGVPGYLDAYVDRMAAMAERLHHVSLECRPALDVARVYGDHPSVLLYLDPPYLGSTRGSSHSYAHEMRGHVAHRDLADTLNACKAAVVLSGYHSPLYDELYRDWHFTEIRAYAGQHNGDRSRERTEVVWSNRPFPSTEGRLM